jgi:hypothetical protein
MHSIRSAASSLRLRLSFTDDKRLRLAPKGEALTLDELWACWQIVGPTQS